MGNIVSYTLGGQTVDIPAENADAFKSKYPDAKQVVSFVLGNDTADIPIENAKAFAQKYPDAKPTFQDQPSAGWDLKKQYDPQTESPFPLEVNEPYKGVAPTAVNDPTGTGGKLIPEQQPIPVASIPKVEDAKQGYSEFPTLGKILSQGVPKQELPKSSAVNDAISKLVVRNDATGLESLGVNQLSEEEKKLSPDVQNYLKKFEQGYNDKDLENPKTQDAIATSISFKHPEISKKDVLNSLQTNIGLRDDLRKSEMEKIKKPNDVNTWFTSGELKLRSGDYNNAEKDFMRGLQINPQDNNILSGLGYLQMKKGNYDDAISLYQQVFQQDKAQGKLNSNALNNISNAYLQKGDFQEAQKANDAQISLTGGNEDSYKIKANLDLARGDTDAYTASMTKLGEIAADNEFAKRQGQAITDKNGVPLAGEYNPTDEQKAQEAHAASLTAFADAFESGIKNTGTVAAYIAQPELLWGNAALGMFQSAYENAKKIPDNLKKGEYADATGNLAAAGLDAMFAVGTAKVPEMRQFMANMAVGQTVLPSELLQPVFAPVSYAIDKFGGSTEGLKDYQKEILNVADLLGSMVLFHKGEKLGKPLAEKIKNNIPLTKSEAQEVVNTLSSITPEDVSKMIVHNPKEQVVDEATTIKFEDAYNQFKKKTTPDLEAELEKPIPVEHKKAIRAIIEDRSEELKNVRKEISIQEENLLNPDYNPTKISELKDGSLINFKGEDGYFYKDKKTGENIFVNSDKKETVISAGGDETVLSELEISTRSKAVKLGDKTYFVIDNVDGAKVYEKGDKGQVIESPLGKTKKSEIISQTPFKETAAPAPEKPIEDKVSEPQPPKEENAIDTAQPSATSEDITNNTQNNGKSESKSEKGRQENVLSPEPESGAGKPASPSLEKAGSVGVGGDVETKKAEILSDVTNLRNAKTVGELQQAILKATQETDLNKAVNEAGKIIGMPVGAFKLNDIATKLADAIEKIVKPQIDKLEQSLKETTKAENEPRTNAPNATDGNQPIPKAEQLPIKGEQNPETKTEKKSQTESGGGKKGVEKSSLAEYSNEKGYKSKIKVGEKYYDNRYGDNYIIEKITPVEGGDVDVTLKYDKGKTRTESGNFLLYHIDAKQHSIINGEAKSVSSEKWINKTKEEYVSQRVPEIIKSDYPNYYKVAENKQGKEFKNRADKEAENKAELEYETLRNEALKNKSLPNDYKRSYELTSNEKIAKDEKRYNDAGYPQNHNEKISKEEHKDDVINAIENGDYTKAISEGRMTAQDAKTIIESAGLEVPKDIQNLVKGVEGADVKEGRIVGYVNDIADKLLEWSYDARKNINATPKLGDELHDALLNANEKSKSIYYTEQGLKNKEKIESELKALVKKAQAVEQSLKAEPKAAGQPKSKEQIEPKEKSAKEEIKVEEPKTQEQRISEAQKKIDDAAKWLKDKLKIDTLPEGTQKASFFGSDDKFIDYVAEAVKKLAATGIKMSDAIKQVIDSLREGKFLDGYTDEEIKATIENRQRADSVNPFINYTPDETGIQNMVTTLERIQQGKEPIEIKGDDKRDWQKVLSNAKNWFNDPINNLEGLIQDVINGKPPTAEENAVMVMHKVDLDNQIASLMDAKNEAIKNGRDAGSIDTNIGIALEKLERYYEAARRSGYEQGLAFNVRKMMLKNDYSLGNTLRRIKATGTETIPKELQKQIEDLTSSITTKDAEMQKMVEQHEKDKAQAVLDAIKETQKKSVKETKVGDPLRKFAAKIREGKISKLTGSSFRSSTIADLVIDSGLEAVAKALDASANLADAIEVGLKKIRETDWYKNLTEKNKFEEEFAKHLNSEYESEKPNKKGKISVEDDKLKISHGYLENLVNEGHETIDQMVDYIKKTPEGENFTEREIRDSISGYGDAEYPDMTRVNELISIAKGEGKLLSGVEDVTGGKRAKHSGYQRRSATDRERRLRAEIYEKNKLIPEDAEESRKSWASALSKIKTGLKNRISDLNHTLDTGEKKSKSEGVKYDDEANNLKDEVTNLTMLLQGLEDKTLSEQQRAENVLTQLEKRGDALDKELSKGNIGYASKIPGISTPKIEAARKRIKDLNTVRDYLREVTGEAFKHDVEIRTKRNNKIYKDLQQKKKDLLEGKYVPKAKKEKLTNSDLEAQQELINREKVKIERIVREQERANRGNLKKGLDKISSGYRASVLSSLDVIGKLLSYGIYETHILQPLKNLTVGQALRYIPLIKDINVKAGTERVDAPSTEISQYAKSIVEFYSKETWKDTLKKLKTGKGKLDILYGDLRDLPPEVLKHIQYFHGALKNPTVRALFKKYTEKSLQYFSEVLGKDITNDVVRRQAEQMAYVASYNDILMGDNTIANSWGAMIRFAENAGKDKHKGIAVAGNTIASVMKVFEPVTKVPVNYANRVISYDPIIGTSKSLTTILAHKGNVENMSVQEAGSIIRNLKNAGVGTAAYAMGYIFYNLFGGYADDKDRKNKDIKQGETSILPHSLSHHPIWNVVQMGATQRTLDEAHKDQSLTNIKDANLKGVKEVTKSIPYLDFATTVQDLMKSDNKNNYIEGSLLRNFTSFMAIQQLAKWTDTNEKGEEIKRHPETMLEYIKTGYPGLRETVKEDIRKVNYYQAAEKFKDLPIEQRKEKLTKFALDKSEVINKKVIKLTPVEYTDDNGEKQITYQPVDDGKGGYEERSLTPQELDKLNSLRKEIVKSMMTSYSDSWTSKVYDKAIKTALDNVTTPYTNSIKVKLEED